MNVYILLVGTDGWFVYADHWYRGAATYLAPGDYPDASELPGNDVISSVEKAGRGMCV